MDFTKFVSMLENEGLFFSRADKLGDPFEASLPKHDAQLRIQYDKFHTDGEFQVRLFRALRKWTTVSCWHMNEQESAAMWRLYAKSDEAIVICSTYQKLFDSVKSNVSVGMVNYIDYSTEQLPKDHANVLVPFVNKRLSFKHEMELRAVIYRMPPTRPLIGEAPSWYPGQMFDDKGVEVIYDLDIEPTTYGEWQKLDLGALIEEIRIAPGAPSWLLPLVTQVARRYGLDKPVRQSQLDDDPLL